MFHHGFGNASPLERQQILLPLYSDIGEVPKFFRIKCYLVQDPPSPIFGLDHTNGIEQLLSTSPWSLAVALTRPEEFF